MPLWNGPTADFAMQPDEFLRSALDQPMSLGSTFFDQATGGIVESFGLGTAIREGMTPDTVNTPNPGETEQDFFRRQMQARGPSSIGQAVGAAAGQLQAALSEDQFKASPYYREGIPYDRGMTSARAQALAEMYDIKKAREFYADKRPITSFIGNILGQATDPINYVPVFGPAARAAAVSRFGTVGGRILVAGADAAANTAIAGVATTEARNRFGDQIDWEDTVSQSAMAALIGGAFGAVGGVLARRAEGKAEALRREAELRLATLERTQEARAALNDAVQSLAIDGEVRLSPGTVDAVTRATGDVERTAATADVPLEFQTFERLKTEAPDVASALERKLTPAQFADETVRFYAPDVADRFDTTLRVVQQNESVIQSLKAQLMDNETFRDVRAGMVKIEQLDQKAARLEAAAQKASSDKERARLAGQAKSIRDEMQKAADAIDREKLNRLADLEEQLAARTTAQERAQAAHAEAKTAFDQIRQEEIRRFIDTSFGARVPPAVVQSEPKPVFHEVLPEEMVAPVTGRPDQPRAPGADPKAIAEQYGVNAETGEFVERAEVDALKAEGRMTEDEIAALADADKAVTIGASWGEALKAAVGCLI